MNITIKRIYDPAAKQDGARVLVDRLWPRGISKDRARLAAWAKEAAPSNGLRAWFHENPGKRRAEFQKKYRAELRAHAKELKKIFAALGPSITFVTAVKDIEHSHAPVLRDFVKGL
ncbi:MAG TPA: DUF488 family protein [Candidatus Paceibacterota bacterium]|nr:DUF488 family protein [Candidatus Paceibacterota bacterium]